VSAWCEENQLLLAQTKMHKKSNEITTIPKLLELLNLSGAIVTIDAMGCQRNICEQMKDRGGDYVIGLKANQKTLYQDVKKLFSDQEVLENSSSSLSKKLSCLTRACMLVASLLFDRNLVLEPTFI